MKNVEKLISSIVGRSGLINGRFDFAPSHPHVPFGINKFTSIGMNAKYGHGTMIADVDSCGISVNRESALYAMVGEYVERLTCSVFPAASKDIICGSYNDLSKLNHRLLHPNDIILFSNEQYNIPEFPFKKFSVNDEVKWLKCKDFRSDQDIYIPAFLIFLGNGIEKIPYTIPTSTSQAAGRTILDAIKGGYLESAERDAWCKFWFLQKDQAFITYNSETILSSFPGDALLNRLFNNKSIKIKVFDLGAFSNVESVAVFFSFTTEIIYYTHAERLQNSQKEKLL